MEYLTTHDLVWINTTITGAVNAYDYVTLEAAVAGQYAYGDSSNVPAQAANLLERLLCAKPFATGNNGTAFIATLSYLNANGYATRIEDEEAAGVVTAVAEGDRPARQAIEDLAAPATEPLAASLTLRKLIAHECNHHARGLALLAAAG